jgi:hypothetical protein
MKFLDVFLSKKLAASIPSRCIGMLSDLDTPAELVGGDPAGYER